MSTPRFTHDCDACTYLGEHEGRDLYHCLQGGLFPTLIVRESSVDSDYLSGSIFAEMGLPDFVEAAKRARELGLPVTREEIAK